MKNNIKVVARNLRKNQTESEKIFWDLVRNRNFKGKKFLRQYPIKFMFLGKLRYFVADFYCAEEKLVIEIDGEIHGDKKEYDELRTTLINKLGMKVIRIKNEDVKDKNIVQKLLDTYI